MFLSICQGLKQTRPIKNSESYKAGLKVLLHGQNSMSFHFEKNRQIVTEPEQTACS